MARFAIFMLLIALVTMLVCVAPCFEARRQLNNMDKKKALVPGGHSNPPSLEWLDRPVTGQPLRRWSRIGHIYGNLNPGPSPGAGHSGPPRSGIGHALMAS
ncbi:hypothetical protein H5410_014285 [Solanum commersonii]|uniref:Transmembrane protein n=1 Tax=Solanum commersonii TaxID=4109 RepID=A0A9J5ZQH4_SOLCO|nr:hypothetical protein H5410_014285 [Solanum commersonii]